MEIVCHKNIIMGDNFEDFLQKNVHPLLFKDPFDFFSKSLIPYMNLKVTLDEIDPTTSIESTLIKGSGQCCICLESFDRWSEMAFTRCNHPFHPACLAGYLEGDGPLSASHRTCPLCRSPGQDLLPYGQDGCLVQFLLALWFRVKAVESCHIKFFKMMQSQTRQLHRSNYNLSLLEKVLGSGRKKLLRREAEALLLKLDAASFLSSVNKAGFLNLLAELEERCMEPGPSAAYRERLLACRFVVDCAPAGPLTAMRAEVAAIAAQLSGAVRPAAALRGAIDSLRAHVPLQLRPALAAPA